MLIEIWKELLTFNNHKDVFGYGYWAQPDELFELHELSDLDGIVQVLFGI